MTRHFGALLALLLSLPAAHADTIKIVVPFAAGGPTDMIARMIGQDMQVRLKSDVVIENRGGAGGVIANEAGARAPADGKTLVFAAPRPPAINAGPRSQPAYDPVKSFTPPPP